jgi:WD40 repeat protein
VTTLKASQQGLQQIKQARSEKGWAVSDFRWIESASEILGTSWEKHGFFAEGISEGTWKRFLAGKSRINAEAFKAYCQVLGLNWEEVVATDEGINVTDQDSILDPNDSSATKSVSHQDWGGAPDVSIFYGRQEELNIIKHWVVEENCCLVTLLGMGGIGKTTLSVKLAQQILETQKTPPIQFVIWRSLRNAPPVEEILTDFIQFFSEQQETDLPAQLEGRISRLLKYLRSWRCLLILDNVESILQAGDRTGRYKLGYEGYGQFLRVVAETAHQSCLILTSREKPQGLAKFEGESLPVRSLQLAGLPETAGRELFNIKGTFTASESQWQTLISRYGGNPLALKIVASSIRDFFDGNISDFLEISKQGAYLFDDIRDLLAQQFQRLTNLEQKIMYWVAIEREPVTLAELQADFVTPILPRELLESLSSLQRRSLLEKSEIGFTQQPVVMEYIINQFIEQISSEITSQNLTLFISHALTKAQAKEYVRETQVSLILQPIAAQLIAMLGSTDAIANSLQQSLSRLRGKTPPETGYAGGNALNFLHHLQVDLSGYDFSHLTVWQAYLQGVNLHDVNFTGADFSHCVFTESLGNTLAATFSPDGQFMATCDTDCRVRIWQVQTGELVLICQGHTNWVRFVVFSPDGQILASGGADNTVKLWNVRDGICIKTLMGHEHEVFSVAFSPDGKFLASGSGDRTIKLWDVWNGTCLKTLTGHTDWVRSVAFSSNRQTLASGSADHTVKLWDIHDGSCVQTLTEHTGWVRSVAFSPDGQILATGSGDRTIKLWDISTGKCLATYTGHQNSVYSVAFSPQADILVSGSGDYTAKLWDWKTHSCIRTLHGHTNEVTSVAFNPNGHSLVCVSLDQTVRLWDCRDGQCLKTWYGHTDWALPVAFSPNGKFLASGSNDKTVKLWDYQTGDCIRILHGHSDFIYGLAFSLDGQILASASTDSSIRLWNVSTGQCFQILQGHSDWVYAVAFHSDGNLLASGSADCTVKLWEIRTGQCLKTLTGHTDKIMGIALSLDRLLASASADQTLRLWDLNRGNCLRILHGHNNRVYAAVFSPDGQTLASCSTDQTVKLWDWRTGECLKTLIGHTNWVFSIAFSPDGQTLASASHDETVRIWDVETGKCHHICTGHARLVSSVAFSVEGDAIASGSQDQTVRIWDTRTGACIRVLIAKRLYEGMKLTSVKGLTQATIATLQTLGALV